MSRESKGILINDLAHMIIPSLAIIGVTIMEVVAMINGHDGVILTAAIAAVGGISGYCVGVHKREKT